MTTNFLDTVYEVPVSGPYDERYFHEDIEGMGLLEIQREFERARLRLMLEQRPQEWLLQRIDRLRKGLSNAE